MYRNYLLMAYRNFLKQKVYSLINIFGLAMGLASALLIFLYIHDELSYDVIHPDAENIYRIGGTYGTGDGNDEASAEVPGAWATVLKQNLPEVEHTFNAIFVGFPTSVINHEDDKIFLTKDGTLYWITPDIHNMLYYHLIKGHREKALDEPNSMVISETAARRVFGTSDPINRTLGIKHNITNNKEIQVQVTGVFEDFPTNSHFRPEYMINIAALTSSFAANGTTLDQMTNANNTNSMFMNSYIKVRAGAPLENINRELQHLADDLVKSDSSASAAGLKVTPILRNIKDLHFDTEIPWQFEGMGNWTYIIVLSSIALLILIVATINYMNLATARANKRGMEVGLRKTFGGMRLQLAGQFLQESLIMTFASFIVALLIVILLLPYFNEISHKAFTAAHLLNPAMLLIMIGVVVFVAFIGGSYPALVLSSFNPVDVLKGKFAKGKGGNIFRNALVTLQFFISILLIITTQVILQQQDLMQGSQLNADGDRIMAVRFGMTAPNNKYRPLKQALLNDPEIEVTQGPHLPRLEYFGNPGVAFRFPDVKPDAFEFRQVAVDYNFPQLFGFEVLAGRYFNDDTPADTSAIMLNESAVRALNMTNEEVLGLNAIPPNRMILNVVGVVKDFPFRSITFPIDPLVIRIRQNGAGIVYIKLPEDKIAEKIAYVEQTWKKVLPEVGLEYWFMSEEFDRMYANEVTIASLTRNLSVLSLLITVLGLAGFSSFTADRRTKEIGIRKVMGASMSQMVMMLLTSFMKLFLLAAVIAIPLAYWMADTWLTNFVYRTPLGFAVFLTSLGVLALVTLITVSFETMRAARINPTKAIRHE